MYLSILSFYLYLSLSRSPARFGSLAHAIDWFKPWNIMRMESIRVAQFYPNGGAAT